MVGANIADRTGATLERGNAGEQAVLVAHQAGLLLLSVGFTLLLPCPEGSGEPRGGALCNGGRIVQRR